MSENGWTTNELGFQWLQHFEKHTTGRIKGTKRLLVLDGHESHNSVQFQDFCKERGIITLCMPPHSSHLLQPLDVGCFGPIKRAYSNQIQDLIRSGINHVTKVEFLPAFRAALTTSFTLENIKGAFRGAGLTPYNPETVISKLNVRLRTPSPLLEAELPWESQTPANTVQFASQGQLISERIVRHQSSSLSPILTAVKQLEKGAQQQSHRLTILEVEVSALRTANILATKRKQRKKKRLQQQGSLTVQDGLDLITQGDIDAQISEERRQGRPRARQVQTGSRRCGRCRKPGHRVETCLQRKEEEIEVLS